MTDDTLDGPELAAIIAAVAAYTGGAPQDLRLRGVELVDQPAGPDPWALVARLHQMDGRRLLQSRRNGR